MSMTPNSSLLKQITSKLISQKSAFSTLATGVATVTAASTVALAAPVGIVLLGTVGTTAAMAAPDYFDCTAGVVEAGVSEADAIAACAGARYPEALGDCVVDVNELTGLTANSALFACGRSRRPVEVADCTIDIHNAFLDSPSTQVLESCSSSLLPERYGYCVVDIVDATEVAVDTALAQCANAGYRPWTIEPRS